MKIRLFPEENNQIVLKIPKEVFIKELSNLINQSKFTIISFNKKDIYISDYKSVEQLEIKLKTNYRNSFKPIISLSFSEEENSTKIHIEYKIDSITKVLMLFFIIIPLIVQISIIFFNYQKMFNSFEFDFISPLLFILILLLMSRLGFYMSLEHSQKALSIILIRIRNKYIKPYNRKQNKSRN